MIYHFSTSSSHLLFIFILSFYHNVAFNFLLKAHCNLVKALCQYMSSEDGCASKLCNRFLNEDTIKDWIAGHERLGTWNGYIVLVMFSYICDANIETILNLLDSLISSATFIFLKYLQTPATPTIYLYHPIIMGI